MSNVFRSEEVNSNAYWEKRFSGDWEVNDGPAQSRFFSNITINNLPDWLLRVIRSENLSVVDWGCAEGDGTDALAEVFRKDQLTGIDFSEIAISKARSRYDGIDFRVEDWLKEQQSNEGYDVVFSSNTLEHFHKPDEVLKLLSRKARKVLILALPFRESSRIPEHFSTFTPQNIQLDLEGGFSLVFSKVIDCKHLDATQWPGEQVILVYLDQDFRKELGLVLSEVCLAAEDWTAALSKKDELTTLVQQKLAISESIIEGQSRDIDNLKADISNLKEDSSKLAELQAQYYGLIDSKSWKVTAPLRYFMSSIIASKRGFYFFAKWVYRNLPFRLQKSLNKPRHHLVRYFRSGSQASRNVSKNGDLSWIEFNQKILKYREDFKGIFVQELTIDWDVPLYQRPQHLSVALGRMGYLVIYRTGNWANDDVVGFREVEKNVWITDRDEVNDITGTIRSFYSTAYAHSPKSIDRVASDNVVIYEYIDHIDPEISGDDQNVKRLQDLKDYAFAGNVDYIIASAMKLYDEAVEAIGESRVVMVPNGVDTRHYRNENHADILLPGNLSDFCQNYENVVGYFGALAPWLWYEAISELVDRRSDLGFVFIGPDYYGGLDLLPKRDNVLYLGAVDYKILPAYARKFNVCFIPFKPGDIAQTTSPLKLFEYFALEKPVVVTSDMLECTKYSEVFSGGSVEELSNALDAAIAIKDNAEFARRMSKLADQNDWDQRAIALAKCFDSVQAPE